MNLSEIDWYKVLPALGVNRHYLSNKHGPCPFPECRAQADGGKRQDRFRFDNKYGLGTWFCSYCGAGNGFTFVRRFTSLPDVEIFASLKRLAGIEMNVPAARSLVPQPILDKIPEAEAKKNRIRLAAAWKKAKAVRISDPVTRYLRARVPGCDITWLSQNIRCHPGMDFLEEDGESRLINRGKYPVMLAMVQSADGHPITLHRTYLTPEGAKAPFEKVKKQMSGVRKLRGAAIRLVEVPSSRTLAICEGIETGWAIATAYRYSLNVWSMLNARNLAAADIPAGRFDHVMIFADHDRFDQKAGYRPGEHFAIELKERLDRLGISNELRVPAQEATDFCDLWNDYYQNSLLRSA
jgi:putative DNA primase/helicase